MQPSTIQKLRSIFDDTESGDKVVVQELQEFVDLIPLPEGVRSSIRPVQMNNRGSMLYKVFLTWDSGNPKRCGPPTVTELFTFSVTLGTGCPFIVTCFNTYKNTQEGCLGDGDIEKFTQEVKAKLDGQIILWGAGKLSTDLGPPSD
jgi:hypothetical protein